MLILTLDSRFASFMEKFIKEKCGKYGDIIKITVFEKNPMGVVIVKFAKSIAAENVKKIY